MTTYLIDPISDSRWAELLARHPQASIFHAPGWLEALRRTYGYESFVLTTSSPNRVLLNGIVFCRIKSWLTGSRLVSLPFSDHCEPLLSDENDLPELATALIELPSRFHSRYIELRPRYEGAFLSRSMGAGSDFAFHRLDLTGSADTIYRRFHKSCVQRKIQKAEREHVTCDSGNSEQLLARFYRLLVLTRRRHQLPPQPIEWFRNVLACLGDRARIYVASRGDQPISSIFTLFQGKTLIYKYGCSDSRFHNLGGMPFLFWNAIQDNQEKGAMELDLGRSDLDNEGLIAFKEHLGATRSKLQYLVYPEREKTDSVTDWKARVLKRGIRWMPDSVFATVGRVLYRHSG